MTDYYASTAIADGTTAAGTVGDPTSIRHAYGTLANQPGDRIFFRNAGAAWTLQVANGSLTSAATATLAAPVHVIGYSNTIDDGGMPEIVASDDSISELILADDPYTEWRNVILTGGSRAVHSNGTSNSRGISFSRAWMRNQTVSCVDTAGHTNEPFVFFKCTFSGAPIGLEIGGRDAVAIDCLAIDCPDAGFQVANNNKGAKLVRCLAHDCGIGFDLGPHEAWLDQCVANRCLTGIDIDGIGRYVMSHCGIVNCTTGVNGSAGSRAQLWNCGTFGNGTDIGANVTLEVDVGRVTADPELTNDNPANPMEVDVSISSSSPWRGQGLAHIGAVSMGSTDIGLVFSAAVAAGERTNRITLVVGG